MGFPSKCPFFANHKKTYYYPQHQTRETEKRLWCPPRREWRCLFRSQDTKRKYCRINLLTASSSLDIMMNLGRYANTIIFCIAFLCLLDLPLTGAFPTMMERKTKGYFSQVSSPRLTIHHTIHHLPSRRHGMVALASASSSQESDHGETLMKISFSLKEGGADEETKATNILQSYIASFPFSAVCECWSFTYLYPNFHQRRYIF